MKRTSIFLVLIILAGIIGCSKKQGEELIIFHAGSLSVPFKEIIEEFKKENPGVEVYREIAGSRECARKISDLNKPCDIMASADYTVIDELLIPGHADWNLKFAANEMTIVFTDKSRKADEINRDNWYRVLQDEEVSFGRSEPDSDPCGYRTVLTMKLAEKYYGQDGLADKLISKNTENIRPKEVDLLALLETGTIDYIFLYRSVAQQHGLKYLILPDEINLKSTGFEDYYKQATVDISGKKPGETITKTGVPMVYGITIPKNSPNPSVAEKFLHFVLNSKKGLAILEKNGQPVIVPSATSTFDKLPAQFKIYARQLENNKL